MKEEERAKLLSRLRKVLALAGSPNEHEAAAAMEKLHGMLAEHNLSMKDVEAGARDEEGFIFDSSLPETDSVPWRRTVLVAVAQLYFCSYFYSHNYHGRVRGGPGYKRKDTHTFVGAAHNAAVAVMMGGYLMEMVDRLAREGARKINPRQRSKYLTSFRHACAIRLSTRIHKRIEDAKKGKVQTETGTNLPALASMYDQTAVALKSYLEEKLPNMTTSKIKATMSSIVGAMDGRAAGDKIGLDSQITGKDGRPLIGNA